MIDNKQPEQMQMLDAMMGALLARVEWPLRPERIRELMTQLRATPLCNEVDDEAAELLAQRFEERLMVQKPSKHA